VPRRTLALAVLAVLASWALLGVRALAVVGASNSTASNESSSGPLDVSDVSLDYQTGFGVAIFFVVVLSLALFRQVSGRMLYEFRRSAYYMMVFPSSRLKHNTSKRIKIIGKDFWHDEQMDCVRFLWREKSSFPLADLLLRSKWKECVWPLEEDRLIYDHVPRSFCSDHDASAFRGLHPCLYVEAQLFDKNFNYTVEYVRLRPELDNFARAKRKVARFCLCVLGFVAGAWGLAPVAYFSLGLVGPLEVYGWVLCAASGVAGGSTWAVPLGRWIYKRRDASSPYTTDKPAKIPSFLWPNVEMPRPEFRARVRIRRPSIVPAVASVEDASEEDLITQSPEEEVAGALVEANTEARRSAQEVAIAFLEKRLEIVSGGLEECERAVEKARQRAEQRKDDPIKAAEAQDDVKKAIAEYERKTAQIAMFTTNIEKRKMELGKMEEGLEDGEEDDEGDDGTTRIVDVYQYLKLRRLHGKGKIKMRVSMLVGSPREPLIEVASDTRYQDEATHPRRIERMRMIIADLQAQNKKVRQQNEEMIGLILTAETNLGIEYIENMYSLRDFVEESLIRAMGEGAAISAAVSDTIMERFDALTGRLQEVVRSLQAAAGKVKERKEKKGEEEKPLEPLQHG